MRGLPALQHLTVTGSGLSQGMSLPRAVRTIAQLGARLESLTIDTCGSACDIDLALALAPLASLTGALPSSWSSTACWYDNCGNGRRCGRLAHVRSSRLGR
jgi:hypothetical protein